MSKIQISPNPSGSGTVTLAAPNTNSDVTLTIPAVSAELITNSSGVLNIGSGQVYKDASGNVGIGTSSPDVRLTVSQTSTVGDLVTLKGANSVNGALGVHASNNGGVYLQAAATRDVRLRIGSTDHVTLDSSGNVGIGTSSPAYKTQIKGAQNSTVFALNDGSAGESDRNFLFSSSANGVVWDINSQGAAGSFGQLTFSTNSTERARIDSAGNLLVGTASQIFGSLVTFRKNGGNTLVCQQDAGSNAAAIVARVDITSGRLVGFNYAGTDVGTITTNGTTTAYNTSSDYRLKENVAPMIGALEKVAQLKPCTYTWKTDGSDGQGFIAHELQEVVPDCVTGTKDAVDKDGNPQYQGVDTSFLIATLTAAIQELTARLEVLENK